MKNRTLEQIAEQNRIAANLKAGLVEEVWVGEVTRGTVGISEATAYWWIIPISAAKDEEAARLYVAAPEEGEKWAPDYDRPYFVTSVSVRRQVAIPGYLREGDGGTTIPAADTVDELRKLFAD